MSLSPFSSPHRQRSSKHSVEVTDLLQGGGVFDGLLPSENDVGVGTQYQRAMHNAPFFENEVFAKRVATATTTALKPALDQLGTHTKTLTDALTTFVSQMQETMMQGRLMHTTFVSQMQETMMQGRLMHAQKTSGLGVSMPVMYGIEITRLTMENNMLKRKLLLMKERCFDSSSDGDDEETVVVIAEGRPLELVMIPNWIAELESRMARGPTDR